MHIQVKTLVVIAAAVVIVIAVVETEYPTTALVSLLPTSQTGVEGIVPEKFTVIEVTEVPDVALPLVLVDGGVVVIEVHPVPQVGVPTGMPNGATGNADPASPQTLPWVCACAGRHHVNERPRIIKNLFIRNSLKANGHDLTCSQVFRIENHLCVANADRHDLKIKC